MPELPKTGVHPTLKSLTGRKDRVAKALERSEKMHEALEAYLSTLHIEHLGAHELDKVVEGYESTGGKLDEKILALEKEREEVQEEITKEEEKIDGAKKDKALQLRSKVSLSLFSEKESEVELILIYGTRVQFFRSAF